MPGAKETSKLAIIVAVLYATIVPIVAAQFHWAISVDDILKISAASKAAKNDENNFRNIYCNIVGLGSFVLCSCYTQHQKRKRTETACKALQV